MKENSLKYADIIEHFVAKGRKTFSLKEVFELKKNRNASYSAVKLLVRKKLVKKVSMDYFVIYSPAEKASGYIPPESYVDRLMSFKKTSYYVSLLSASLIYGASHQRPVIFQVVTDRQVLIPKKLLEGIEFHTKSSFPENCIIKQKGQFGYINYSSPALTAYDLVKFERDSGTLSNVIPVISELLHSFRISDIKNLMKIKLETAYVQRLGFILEKLEAKKFAAPLIRIAKEATAYVPLSRLDKNTGEKNKRWMIINNIEWNSALAP